MIDIAHSYDLAMVVNWSIQSIKSGLQIEQSIYDAIYSAVECEMTERGLLRKRLNTIPSKRRMQEVSAVIYTKFPVVFDEIPQAWKDKCLLVIAQKCNYNEKRRVPYRTLSIPGTPKIEKTLLIPSKEPLPERRENGLKEEGTQTTWLPFDSIHIYIYHQGTKRATLYRPQDFLKTGTGYPGLNDY